MDLVERSPVATVQKVLNQLGEPTLHVCLTMHEKGLYHYLRCVQILQVE